MRVFLFGVKLALLPTRNQTDHRSVLGPALVEVNHERDHLGMAGRVSVQVGGDNVPRLLIVAGRCPASRFNAGSQLFRFNTSFGAEGVWTPATSN